MLIHVLYGKVNIYFGDDMYVYPIILMIIRNNAPKTKRKT